MPLVHFYVVSREFWVVASQKNPLLSVYDTVDISDLSFNVNL